MPLKILAIAVCHYCRLVLLYYSAGAIATHAGPLGHDTTVEDR